MRTIIVAVCVALGCSAMAKAAEAEPETTTVIDSEKVLGECLISVQWQYFPVCLPSLSERLLQPAGSFPFDHEGFDSEPRATFRGWIDADGIVHYAVGLCEDYWTGEIVVLDDTGWEMFRIPRKKTYDPYDLQREFFDLGKKEVLEDDFTREVFLPSKICTVVDLIPLVFWDAHLQIEQENSMQQLSAPAMMAMGSGGSENPTASMTLGSNDLITLHITLPEGFGRYLEIFKKDDLVLSPAWSLCDSWIPTYGSTNISWIDPASSNSVKGFFHLSNAVDSDGDGFSNLREAWVSGTDSNSFNTVTNDADSLHDWWELKLFGDLDETESTDFDGDGLLNGEEMEYFPGSPPTITLLADPSLYDTDDDGLNDFEEVHGTPPTDPWNPDASAPVVSIGSPVGGTTFAP